MPLTVPVAVAVVKASRDGPFLSGRNQRPHSRLRAAKSFQTGAPSLESGVFPLHADSSTEQGHNASNRMQRVENRFALAGLTLSEQLFDYALWNPQPHS